MAGLLNLLSVANENNISVLHKHNTLHMNLDLVPVFAVYLVMVFLSVVVMIVVDVASVADLEVAAAALLAVAGVAGIGGGIH